MLHIFAYTKKQRKMRAIDGTRYISAREYAEMMNLTPGRVSQMKAELPFVKFEEFGVEVINFDLLELGEHQKALAQSRFETTSNLMSYSYKDLGNFFGKLLHDLVQFKGNADIRIKELDGQNQQLAKWMNEAEDRKAEAEAKAVELEKNLLETWAKVRFISEENLKLSEEVTALVIDKDDLANENEELHRSATNEKVIKAELEHRIEIKILENANLVSENESLKNRIAAMEASANAESSFRDEFKSFKEMVMAKIK
jgi:DNA repair exonuclease SbcCD nuclease subunit